LQPPSLGPHFQHAGPRRVVDIQVRGAESFERMRDVAVFLLANLSAHEPVIVDFRFRPQQAHEQLLLRHLQAEETDDPAGRGDVLRNVQHETRLPHRGSSRDDNQIAALEAARHLVDFREARRNPRDEALVFEELLDLREAVLDQISHRDKPGLDPVIRNGKDRALGFVEDQVGFLVSLVRIRQDFVRGVNQAAKRGFLLHDLRVVLDVGSAARRRRATRCTRGLPLRRVRRRAPTPL